MTAPALTHMEQRNRLLRAAAARGEPTLTIDEANYAIDHGFVWCRMGSSKQWQARRNGATQTWKSRPGQCRLEARSAICAMR